MWLPRQEINKTEQSMSSYQTSAVLSSLLIRLQILYGSSVIKVASTEGPRQICTTEKCIYTLIKLVSSVFNNAKTQNLQEQKKRENQKTKQKKNNTTQYRDIHRVADKARILTYCEMCICENVCISVNASLNNINKYH